MTEENGLYIGVYITEDPLDEINVLYYLITLFRFPAFKPHTVYLWAKYSNASALQSFWVGSSSDNT